MSGPVNAAKTVARLAKPELRGACLRHNQRSAAIAGAGALATALAYKYLVAEPRKRAYAEFYRNYDADAESERLDALGMFHYGEEIDVTQWPWPDEE